MNTKRLWPLVGFVSLGFLAAPAPAAAEVVTDGTVGPTGPLAGPNVTIPAEVGRQAGKNLFHSFKTFNVYRGESATFTGPSGLDNVISRVTGGERSMIDGLLSSKIPNADFWFLNPSGVVFGPNAQLDVPASFHVSTADELRFEDGAVFSARDPSVSTLTVAAPEAFGFLGQNAGVTVDRSKLELGPAKTLSVVGGDVTISSGKIEIPQGRLNLVARSSAGEVAVENPGMGPSGRGDVIVANGSLIDVGGTGGGVMWVRAGKFYVADGSVVAANNSSALDATGKIDVDAEEIIVAGRSRLRTNVFGSGKGGRVKLLADRVEVSGDGEVAASTFAEGDAGRVDITARELHVRDRGVVESSTRGERAVGAAGNVNVAVEDLEVSGVGWIQASSLDGALGRAGHVAVSAKDVVISGREGNVSSGLFATGADDGGSISVKAETLDIVDGSSLSVRGGQGEVQLEVGELNLSGGGQVDTSTQTARNAGDIKIQAGTISIAGIGHKPDGSRLFSGLFARSEREAGGGDAGFIEVEARELVLRESGSISARSFSEGNGGAVTVNIDGNVLISGGFLGAGGGTGVDVDFGSGFVSIVADRVLIEDRGEISARGTQGSVRISARDLSISGGGLIQTATDGVGQGGDLVVDAATVTISGSGSALTTESESAESISGRGGVIRISADKLALRDGGAIKASTFGGGRGGDIVITVTESVSILNSGIFAVSDRDDDGGDAGNIEIDGGRVLALTAGSIETLADSGSGGRITIRAGKLIDLNNSRIASSVFGGEDTTAGDITIDPEFLILNDSNIRAGAFQGRGGNIDIDADFILRSAESRIDASSELGIDGTITASNPEIDLSKGLRELPVDFLDASAQMPLSCEARRASGESNFGMIGRGVPPGPDAPSPGFYLLDHDAGAGPGTSDSGELSEAEEVEIASFDWPTIHGDCSTR